MIRSNVKDLACQRGHDRSLNRPCRPCAAGSHRRRAETKEPKHIAPSRQYQPPTPGRHGSRSDCVNPSNATAGSVSAAGTRYPTRRYATQPNSMRYATQQTGTYPQTRIEAATWHPVKQARRTPLKGPAVKNGHR